VSPPSQPRSAGDVVTSATRPHGGALPGVQDAKAPGGHIELIDLVEEADDGAVAPSWDEIAERYGDTVYAMAYRLCGDRDEALDLAQDVFVRVYRNLDRYRPGTFEGWLYRITRNLFLDRVRRRSRLRMEPLPVGDWREPPEPGPGPAERVEERILDDRLESALAELPATFRTAVVLCDVRGLTYDEIVATTGWPMGTVRSRIHRGRKLLRQRLSRRG
jgi:RNA polymerase sigma-70 factor (ECF subfamily)